MPPRHGTDIMLPADSREHTIKREPWFPFALATGKPTPGVKGAAATLQPEHTYEGDCLGYSWREHP